RRRGDGAARAPPRRRRRIRDHVRAPAPLARADLQGGRPMNAQPLSLPQATYLVAEREVTTRVRSKAFVISTLILLIGIVVGIVAMNFFANREESTSVATTGEIAATLSDLPGVEITEVGSSDEARGLVESVEVDAAVISRADSPTGTAIVAL